MSPYVLIHMRRKQNIEKEPSKASPMGSYNGPSNKIRFGSGRKQNITGVGEPVLTEREQTAKANRTRFGSGRKQNITGVGEPIHVKETVVTNSHGTTFIRRAFDRIGRKTGITQKAALNKSLKLMSDVYGDSVLKGDLTKHARYSTDKTFRELADNLLSAERDYANTPLSKVENFVRGAAGLVKDTAKLTWYTLRFAFNFAMTTGKFIFNTVKKWVHKAVEAVERRPKTMVSTI